MASSFSFPEMTTAEVAQALHQYNIAPTANLRAEDIANPQSELLQGVFSLFLSNILDVAPDEQLGFELLQEVDNPELHLHAIVLGRIFRIGWKMAVQVYCT